MTMKLQSLKAYNFMPYKGELNLEFPQDEQRNVVIIFGDNMRGKTSILNAIRWGFYGTALGRHSRPIPLQKIVNREATLEDDWTLSVHIRFEANGHDYDLRRIANRRNLVVTPSKEQDFEQTVHLIKDGAAVPGDQIEPEIGRIAPEQVSRFFLFDGELLQEYETLLIEDSQQGEQIKEAIEDVLGVPALSNGRIDIQTILKQAQKRQNADLKQVAGLEKQAERLDELTERRDSIDRDLDDLQRQLAEVRDARTNLQDELEAAEKVIHASATLDAKKDDRAYLIQECEKKEEERLDLISDAWRDLIDGQLAAKRLQLEQTQKDLLQSIDTRSKLEKRVADLKDLLDTKVCPTCEQDVGQEHRDHFGKLLGEAEVELDRLDDSSHKIQRIAAQLEQLSKVRHTNAKERLTQLDKALGSNQVRLTQIENDIERLRDEIEGYDTAELARKRVMHDEKIKEEGKLQADIQAQQKVRKDLTDELAVSQKAIEGLTKERTQKSTVKVSVCTKLEELFSRSIEKLRDRLRQRVESLANEAFKDMTTQKSYRGLEINENYGLQIIDSSGQHVAVRSAGAEQIVALSLIDGLNRTGRAAGPIIMDTPFGRLDQNHRDNVLEYLPKVTCQFVLLVHSGEIRRETDLVSISDRIGATYEISEVSATHSRLERVTL